MLILQAQNLHNFNSSRLKIGYPGTFVWKILSLHKKLGCLKVHILCLFKRTLSQVSVHSFGHCSKCTKIILIILFFPFLFCLEIYPIILWSSSSLSSPQVGGFVLPSASVMFSAWPMPKWRAKCACWHHWSCEPKRAVSLCKVICYYNGRKTTQHSMPHIFFWLPLGNAHVS